MKRSGVSRADLLMVLAQHPDSPERIGALIGFQPVPKRNDSIDSTPSHEQSPSPAVEESASAVPPPPLTPVASACRTWRVVEAVQRQSSSTTDRKIVTCPTLPHKTDHPPRVVPLASSHQWLARLRMLWHPRPGQAIDLPRVIGHLCRGEVLTDLPRQRNRGWGPSLHVIVDRSERLIPYWADQQEVVRALLPLFPRGQLHLHVVSEIDPPAFTSLAQHESLSGAPVLVLGDLGALERRRSGIEPYWCRLGRRIREAEARPLAVVPCALTYVSPDSQAVWDTVPWAAGWTAVGQSDRPVPKSALHCLQVLLSQANRLESGLVRAVRQLLPEGNLDPALESFFWQAPELIGTSSSGATWNPDAAKRLRAEFDGPFHPQADHLRQQALRLHATWRRHLPDEIYFEELLGLDSQIAKLGWEKEYLVALDYFRWLAQHPELLIPDSPLSAWCRRWERRISDSTGRESPAADPLAQIWGYVHQHDTVLTPPPSWLNTVQLQATQDAPEQTIVLCESSDGLCVQRLTDGPRPLRVVAELKSRNGLLQTDVPFWKGTTPTFAKRYGRDQYGAWFEFEVDRSDAPPVRQRMRWIPAGTFLMGSPASDEEGYVDERPQHSVTISRGFWMSDTPCPQELWQTVMGENPSYFSGAPRPVERVSWNEVQEFAKKLVALLGLKLNLPSEAEWEYACRAGTTTRYHWGDTITPQDARYDQNSVDGATDVGSYPPNAWGLFDMHGNVWEWCHDSQRPYSKEAVVDPLGNTKDSAERVVRGGSWHDRARSGRAAYRLAYDPGYRSVLLGFRCVWVQSVAEPIGPVRRGRRDEGAEPDHTGGARAIRVEGRAREIALTVPRTLVRTDCEQVTLEVFERPPWASAFGRDRYGLWADLRIDAKVKPRGRSKKSAADSSTSDNVVQRLRWIPPGQFRMGSPESEEGRYDDEGPQHSVTITQGFWIFDTSCRQGLWQAVMGDNPSRFPHPQRPVDSINWQQARDFAERLSVKFPDLTWDLPTEAQWEYACRAGTESATYAGPITILGERNAPELHDIAWYGGNSGKEFDLPDGYDSAGWKEKQFLHQHAGTRDVAQKRPNAWGLYDMLGNVWEWCRDGKRKYSEHPVMNPEESAEEGARRVVRGGGWSSHARRVRAANRREDALGLRDGDLGCRYVGVRSPSRASAAREVVERDE